MTRPALVSRALLAGRLVAAAVAIGLIVGTVRQIDVSRLAAVTMSIQPSWIALALILNGAILVAWSALWRTVTPSGERPTPRVMFEINAMASALMNTLPLFGGHAAALVLLVQRGGLTPSSATSVLALDQLFEGLAKLTVFLFVVTAAPLPSWMRVSMRSAGVAVAVLFLILFALAHGVSRQPAAADGDWIGRLRTRVMRWGSRLETLRTPRRMVLALACAIGTKVLEGSALACVQLAFGVHLTVGSTALVLAAVILGSALPLAPGNVGIYEASAVLAYRHAGIDPALAAAMAVVAHVAFLVPGVGIGVLLTALRARTRVEAR